MRRSTACCASTSCPPPSWTRPSNPPAPCSTSDASARIDPYRLVRSFDGLLREFEYQIDSDRFLRIVARDRVAPILDAAVVPYEKLSSVVAIRGRIDADHSSVIAAMNAAGESVHARDDGRGDLRRPD